MGAHEDIGAKKPRVLWTDDRLAALTKMWNEGLPASHIAKTLGGITRNAVIGKAHRSGLPRRRLEYRNQQALHERRRRGDLSGSGKGWRREKPTTVPKPIKAVQVGNVVFVRDGSHEPRAVPLANAFKALPDTNPRPFMERSPGGCRWPIDGEDGQFLCCNERIDPDHPSYCWAHRKLAGVRSMTAADALANERRRAKRKKLREAA